MDQFSKDFGGLHSPTISTCSPWAWFPARRSRQRQRTRTSRGSTLHDMDSLEFLLWVEQEAEREMARRKGQAAEPAPAQSPEKTGTV